MDVRMPDGTMVKNVPEGVTKTQLLSKYQKYTPKPQEETKTDIGRGFGIGARDIAMGASYPARLIADTIGMGANALAGTDVPLPSQGFEGMLDKFGLPRAGSKGERVLSAATQGATNPLSLFGPGIIGPLSGATGGASSQVAAENGAGPIGQTIAGLAGGMVPSAIKTAGTSIASAAKGSKAAVEPFYKGGREKIAGKALNKIATNPKTALQNLDDVQEYVPGSKSTTGQASKDYGMLSAERGLKNMSPQKFAETESRNNSARNVFLQGIAKEQADIDNAITLRERATAPLREGAFKNPKGPVKIEPVIKEIDDVLASPKGANPEVRTGLRAAKEYLLSLENIWQPETAYEARKGLASTVEKALESPDASKAGRAKQLSGGILYSITKKLDDQIDAAAPGYKDYMSTYSQMSKPIEQMTILQDVGSKTKLAVPDPLTGLDQFSQAKWSNVLRNNADELKKVLTPSQLKKLERITLDLDRGAATNSPLIRAAGSDTVQNLTTANILGEILGSGPKAGNPALDTLMRPLQWIYKIPNDAVQDLVVDAMNDPTLAKKLMARATTLTTKSLGKALQQRAVEAGYGAAIGSVQEKRQSDKKP